MKNLGRIGLIGDMHHGMKNGNHAMREYQKKMLLEYIIPYYKSRGITELYEFGDFHDNRRYVLGIDLHWMRTELIPLLAENGMTLWTTVGNHNISLKDSVDINHCNILEDLSIAHGSHCIKSFNDPVEHTFGSLKVLALPWVTNSNYNQVVEAIEESTADVVFAHLEMEGFVLTKGKLCEHGQLSTKMFEKFSAVYNGHFHIGSEKVLESGTLFKYLGIPYEQCWGDYESGVENGVYELDTETQVLTFVPNGEDKSIFKVLEYNYENIASTKKGKLWLDKEFLEDTLHLKDKVIRVEVTDRSNSTHYKNFLQSLRLIKCVNFVVVDLTREVITEEQDIDSEEFKTDTLEILLEKVESTEGINNESVANKLEQVYTLCVNKSNII